MKVALEPPSDFTFFAFFFDFDGVGGFKTSEVWACEYPAVDTHTTIASKYVCMDAMFIDFIKAVYFY